MAPGPSRTPFAERGGPLRGVLDLVTGRYPAFLFGGTARAALPVFHLHESSAPILTARLEYLADNGYRTVTSDAVTAWVRQGRHPGERTVALCFDDAWSSLWTTAAPLLKRFGFTAITFAIPARIRDAEGVRPTIENGAVEDLDRSDTPFVTWPELVALFESGIIDVQSHSYSHSMLFSSDTPVSFVSPAFTGEPLLNRPRICTSAPSDLHPQFLDPNAYGAPLYDRRSRLSDAWRYLESPDARERCMAHVRQHGGPDFFNREGWVEELKTVHASANGAGRYEDESKRRGAILEELDRSRAELRARLPGARITQVCAPWGIAGGVARDTARTLGFDALFADRLFGRRVVRAGDDPFSLMRLHERFIACLPGRGRRYFFSAR